MKIAVVATFLYDRSVGGVENYIRFICKELSTKGQDLRIFAPKFETPDGVVQHDERDLPVTRVNVGKAPYNLIALSGSSMLGMAAGFLNKLAFSFRPRPVVAAIAEWEPDVVWQHDFSSNWVTTRILSRRF